MVQPAFFSDGQLLTTTHYHVDACLWEGDTFIDGATFLMPSTLPEVGLGHYSVDLDEVTGVYHVIFRNAKLRASLALSKVSKPDFSSHTVEFSDGKMTMTPRLGCATNIFKGENPKLPATKMNRDNAIVQPEVVQHEHTEKQPRLACLPVLTIHASNPSGITSTPAGSDSSITRFGRVVGQQADSRKSSLSSFSESIMHILPGKIGASSSIEAKCADTAAQGPVQEPMEIAGSPQTPNNSARSRRSSSASQSSDSSASTVPTSPTSSTFSRSPSWKSVLASLPRVPNAPGEPSQKFKALDLEQVKQKGAEITVVADPDATVFRRLSWDLKFSFRQLNNLEKIQDGSFPSIDKVHAPTTDLAIDEDGQIIMAKDTGTNVQS